MITTIIYFLLAVIFGAIATLLIIKRNKKILLNIAVITISLAFIILGGVNLNATIITTQNNSRNIYLALSCLRDNNIPKAQIFIQGVKSPNKTQKFIVNSCEALLHRINKNETLAKIKLSNIKENEINANQKAVFTFVQTVDISSQNLDTTKLQASFSSQCIEMLKLNDKTIQKFKDIYSLQTGSFGNVNPDDEELNKKFSKNELEIFQLDAYLSQQNYQTALQLSTEMLNSKPSTENRMLVAGVIAEMTYSGQEITNSYFVENDEKATTNENQEVEALVKQLNKINEKIMSLQSKIDISQNNEESLLVMLDEMQKLTEEQKALKLKSKNIYVYRAINSINDINTIESKILQSRLFYSMKENEEAQKLLVKAADSLNVIMSNDVALKASLKLVKDAYDNKIDNSLANTPEFIAAINVINNSAISKLTSIGNSTLSNDITKQISDDLKYQSNDVFINAIDDTNYPKVVAKLSASDLVRKDIKSNTNITINDTGIPISYKIVADDVVKIDLSICAVLDISGSMSGEPLTNAKNAMKKFAATIGENTSLAYCTFSDTADIITSLTKDKVLLQSNIENTSEGGGTNIAAGILKGIEALENSNGEKIIMLLTDGQSAVDSTTVENAIVNGIKIITIGFGGVDDTSLTYIAEATGGTYIKADDSDELLAALGQISSQLNNTINIEYTVTENVDALDRYLFVKSNKYLSNSKRTYLDNKGNEIKVEKSISINRVHPGLLDTINIENNITNNKKIEAQIQGDNLNLIESVSFLGETIPLATEPEQKSIKFEISSNLEEKSYELGMNLIDGTTFVIKNFITIYNRDNLLTSSTYKVGSLYLRANSAIKVNDNSLLLYNTTFSSNGVNYGPKVLSSTVDMPVLMTAEFITPVENEEYKFSLGASGVFEYTGEYAFDNTDYIANTKKMVIGFGQIKGVVNDISTAITMEDIKNESK